MAAARVTPLTPTKENWRQDLWMGLGLSGKGGSRCEEPDSPYLVAQGGQVRGRLLSHSPDLCCRHQRKDILHGGSCVCPELVPKSIVGGFHGLQGNPVSRVIQPLSTVPDEPWQGGHSGYPPSQPASRSLPIWTRSLIQLPYHRCAWARV